MRSISPSFVVTPPTGAQVRTRLRLNIADQAVLLQVGEYLGSLAGGDLAARSRLGRAPDAWTDRKRALTAACSSRWSGAITRTSNDQWTRGYQNLLDERARLHRAIRCLQHRVQAPVGGKTGKARGYATPAERWAKQRRLQVLTARLARVQARLAAARVSVVRGGRRLARLRQHLGDAGLTESQWRQRWTAERLFLAADGEAEKTWGNETIRWHPLEGWLELKLPMRLAHLANRPYGRYRLTCPVAFPYRGDEVAAQAASGAVRYEITLDPDRQRWYLAASWTVRPGPTPSIEQAVAGGVVAVDLNADHLACWIIDHHGNPVGPAVTIPLDLAELPQATRDGRLRAAISSVLELARAHAVGVVAIEDLGFADSRAAGRETLGRGSRGKRLRRVISGIPTGRFRDRLVQMAHNQGLWVVAADPAYTSRWGGQHWQIPLQQRHPTTIVTRHHAASVVIGRRALGYRARRRAGILDGDQRITGASNCRPGRPQPGRVHGPGPPGPPPPHSQAGQTGRGHRDRPRAQAAQDRSGSPISRQQKMLPDAVVSGTVTEGSRTSTPSGPTFCSPACTVLAARADGQRGPSPGGTSDCPSVRRKWAVSCGFGAG
jgi:hypothetical protein